MKVLTLTRTERDALWADLEAMPAYLAARFSALPAAEATRPGPDGGFSPVEQCWHLADLEREGYAVRIVRLLSENGPHLPDFDGDAVAAARGYRRLSLDAGLQAFRDARAENLARLRAIGAGEWSREGSQEGVGRVALCDVPAMMAAHDASHRAEIEAWTRDKRR